MIMDRKSFIKKVCESVDKQSWLSDLQREELEATISHWCQSKKGISVPFFTDDIKNECLAIINEENRTAEEVRCIKEESEPYQLKLDFMLDDIPYPPPREWNFTFIDLFAGIGGFRLAFQASGGKCIFSSEWDKYAKKTYSANFGEVPFGDIRKIDKKEIPDHDVLCAGFPCQPFSIAGVSKKQSLGRKHGFEDETQGTLFFEIKEIIKKKRPKAFMLENVRNLLSHDKGKTFEVIRHALEDSLGYVMNWKIVDGGRWVPQHRKRIFIVGYDPNQIKINKDEINIPEKPCENYSYPELNSIISESVDDHTLGPGTWATLVRHKANHEKKGNGFGYGIHKLPLEKGAVTRTISARYHKDGAEILIHQENNRPRRLTVKEAMQLQGYDPAKYIFPVSNTQAYRQIGNSVVVPAISECAAEIAKVLERGGHEAC